eukprot:365148-Chlamydomonas_euryale.AAC.14
MAQGSELTDLDLCTGCGAVAVAGWTARRAPAVGVECPCMDATEQIDGLPCVSFFGAGLPPPLPGSTALGEQPCDTSIEAAIMAARLPRRDGRGAEGGARARRGTSGAYVRSLPRLDGGAVQVGFRMGKCGTPPRSAASRKFVPLAAE